MTAKIESDQITQPTYEDEATLSNDPKGNDIPEPFEGPLEDIGEEIPEGAPIDEYPSNDSNSTQESKSKSSFVNYFKSLITERVKRIVEKIRNIKPKVKHWLKRFKNKIREKIKPKQTDIAETLEQEEVPEVFEQEEIQSEETTIAFKIPFSLSLKLGKKVEVADSPIHP